MHFTGTYAMPIKLRKPLQFWDTFTVPKNYRSVNCPKTGDFVNTMDFRTKWFGISIYHLVTRNKRFWVEVYNTREREIRFVLKTIRMFLQVKHENVGKIRLGQCSSELHTEARTPTQGNSSSSKYVMYWSKNFRWGQDDFTFSKGGITKLGTRSKLTIARAVFCYK